MKNLLMFYIFDNATGGALRKVTHLVISHVLVIFNFLIYFNYMEILKVFRKIFAARVFFENKNVFYDILAFFIQDSGQGSTFFVPRIGDTKVGPSYKKFVLGHILKKLIKTFFTYSI